MFFILQILQFVLVFKGLLLLLLCGDLVDASLLAKAGYGLLTLQFLDDPKNCPESMARFALLFL